MNGSHYTAGYSWAQQSLQSKALTPDDIEVLADVNGINPTEFDRGAREALRQFKEIA